MKILRSNQYNQGIGKYKLLSSTSGVGSIITTKVGSYVLISDMNKWKFIKWANAKVGLVRTNNTDDRKVYEISRTEMCNRGFEFIDDQRFIKFIKTEKDLINLVCLIGIPHMSLNESSNTPNWKNHPIKTALEASGENAKGAQFDYMITGTHFPKWFKNRKGELKEISEWKGLWEKESRKNGGTPSINDFAPPRDATDFIRFISVKNSEGKDETYREYKELDQINLTLICPNGHLSDIPWSKFLNWKTLKETFQLDRDDTGKNLFDIEPCCSNSNLIWTESKTKSEGYGSIFIECKSCGLGSGVSKEKPKINLEGINGLQPYCKGQKPWEIELDNPNAVPYEKCYIGGELKNDRERMQVSLVTANNMYYANGFSSLFIPMHLAENKSKELNDAISLLETKYNKYFERTAITREEYWNSKFDYSDFLIDNNIRPNDESVFKTQLESEFLNMPNTLEISDRHEEYRWEEYRCFSQNSLIQDIKENKGLSFQDIQLPTELKPFFTKIQQVEELKVTNIQLDFTRSRPKERIIRLNAKGEKVVEEASVGQNIFSNKKEELFVLPANETYGEGLFFQFSDDTINKWIEDNSQQLEERFFKFLNKEIDGKEQLAGIKQKIKNNGIKHFLIHSFSHIMMRELEFSCGYPTASLKERLYISNTPEKVMSGVLIFTAEGSEGSMGGLVSQGEPEKILEILKKGLQRCENCSSDPLCWESDGQGILDLNLSACFSCSLVSETACEEMNLGLDRRVLIDEEVGFFIKMI
ncbi:DUF1998 domain-containing protein [Chryseobacterium sp. JV558]|uniref:DUF1998 domain-containing protein n=1 Tax=Chryseobacterium sp. JV558 TaxID=2663236 RepID=UPI00299CD56F|nr:DUF1998 domain-containing protein [Chryseobacterium sp. JV558]MDW9382502.1 hypothetical protein [Chryseobacterium sp. JV558]